MEAGGTTNHGARELAKLGHTVKLMWPAYVKPYVKRGKIDAAEAVQRPTMPFAAVKMTNQQAVLMLLKALRGHLAEFGTVAAGVRSA